MDDDIIEDLKQFITTTVAQAVAGLPSRGEMTAQFAELDARFEKMDSRFEQIDLRFDDLELKVDTIADAHAIMLEDHDIAINHLQSIEQVY